MHLQGLTLRRTLAAAALTCFAAALWLAAPSPAIVVVGGKPAPLGLVGMTEGQILRVSVANVVGFDPQPDPPGCRLQVGFVDAQNTGYGIPDTFELRPGFARSFDHVAVGNPNIRQYVRPVVVDLNPRAECPAVVSGELLDREGINGIIVYDSVAFVDPWLGK
jgi:hypothetical protein